ncbi:glycosyltransferase family 4 protein [Hoeflea sp.]|uniref:glycosyltransferase family 4 protein n=1 Tax=Hoeflea sp. TaxID=1940281 RepID=UPI003B02DEDA
MSGLGKSGKRLLVWQWGRRGAGPRFAAELAEAFERTGHEPVLSLSQRAESFAGLKSLCTRGYHIDAGGSLLGQARFGLGLPVTLSKLENFLRHESIDAAVCAMPGYWDRAVAAKLRRAGIPLVTIVHDWRAHAGDGHDLVYRLQRGVIRDSAAIVTLSDHVEQQLRGGSSEMSGLRHLRRLAHPPFAFSDLMLKSPVAWKPHGGPSNILIVGRIKAYKGVETALAMMDHLSDVPVRLRIAGALGRPKWRVRAEAMNSVHLRPEWLSERDLVAEIDAADIVLFPYVAATQSGLIPLCQSRGRVVVVSPAGGIAEQVAAGRDGVVTEAATARSLAGAVRNLVDDPAFCRRLAENALADHVPEPEWSKLASGIVDLCNLVQRDVNLASKNQMQ